MALEMTDFVLTKEQLEKINHYFYETNKLHAVAGEDVPCSVKVEFEWSAPFGRFVTAFYDGAKIGCDIEDPSI
jgi:hypothetical protein